MTDTQWVLTPTNYGEIDQATDRDGIFAKNYTESRGKRVVTVGIRIGEKPNHVVARFGDTITRHHDGTWTVQCSQFVPDAPRAPGLCATCGDSQTWHRTTQQVEENAS